VRREVDLGRRFLHESKIATKSRMGAVKDRYLSPGPRTYRTRFYMASDEQYVMRADKFREASRG
jgi:hypothetical protein